MVAQGGVASHQPPELSGHAKHDLSFQFEPLKTLLLELGPLIKAHYDEIQETDPLDPDFVNLLFFAMARRYHIATARTKSGALVGYCCGWVVSKMIDKKSKVLCVNAIYLDPIYRQGFGPSDRFMEMMDGLGRQEGCQRMEMAPMGANSQRMGVWLKRRYGFVDSPEPCYWKTFDGTASLRTAGGGSPTE